MDEDLRRYLDEVDRARSMARRMRWLGIASIVAGVVLALGVLIDLFSGSVDVFAAAEFVLLFCAAAVASGVAFLATGSNLALNASRMELQVRPLLKGE